VVVGVAAMAVAFLAGSAASALAQTPPLPPVTAQAVQRPTTPELDARGLALTQQRGCTACHAPSGTRVGPGFAQIAARYRNDPEADGRLPQKIRNGGVGTWGRIIMPRQPQVSEAEAKVLGAWVLSRLGS
jgi:cytochrome c